jgi:malate synthase
MSAESRTPMAESGQVEVHAADPEADVLSPEALELLRELHVEFDSRRRALLAARVERQREFDAGGLPDFLERTREVRDADWQIEPVPAVLTDRRVEITGPTERKMMINALNSGANVFLADFEDALSPTWFNVVQGQRNVRDAVRGTIALTTEDGRDYRLGEARATMVIRPRGWHLDERHLVIDGAPIAAALVDFGLFLFHSAEVLAASGKGPFLYLPKLESHLEARLWRDVFVLAEDRLGLGRGTIKATVLIETITAAFEMDEILYELREHVAGLNAGRWDYIFSVIKRLRSRPASLLPDRAQVTMTVPFMRAYTELLVRTCHRRGAHAIGGMAAFIPNRRMPDVTEKALEAVRQDKRREATDGFDGSWVAHPDLVAVARQEFDRVLGDSPNQLERRREDVEVDAADLLDFTVPGGRITAEGLRSNIGVGLQYLGAWLDGTGAVAIFNLMEDAATAEISRSQIWQWIHHGARLDGTETEVDRHLVQRLLAEELRALTEMDPGAAERLATACEVLEAVALGEEFVEFLTLPAGVHLG